MTSEISPTYLNFFLIGNLLSDQSSINPITKGWKDLNTNLVEGDSDSSCTSLSPPAEIPKQYDVIKSIHENKFSESGFTLMPEYSQEGQIHISDNIDILEQQDNASDAHNIRVPHSPATELTLSGLQSPLQTKISFSRSIHDSENKSIAPSLPFNTANGKYEGQEGQWQQWMTQSMEPEAFATIPPKDTIMKFDEPEGPWNIMRYGSISFEGYGLDKPITSEGPQKVLSLENNNLIPSQIFTRITAPQRCAFVANPQNEHNSPKLPFSVDFTCDGSETNNTLAHMSLRNAIPADEGIYSCTYHDCSLRFDTRSLLRKHKREHHQRTRSRGTLRSRKKRCMTLPRPNTQTGPYRCDRINPTTGKPCSTTFSRPYDLTRHEDTIHNTRKQKLRCNLCNKGRTYTRMDALQNHHRVGHTNLKIILKQPRRNRAPAIDAPGIEAPGM